MLKILLRSLHGMKAGEKKHGFLWTNGFLIRQEEEVK
jgi:hypothetical protein